MTPPTLPTTLLLLLFAAAAITGAHSQVPPEYPTTDGSVTFKPSIAIVVAIFSLMFSITFLLLMYAKFCHNIRRNRNNNGNGGDAFLLDGDPNRTSSGIDKTVIDSLPFFRFSALQGKRDGLECSVCLSKFSDAEILRLLPTCKHAFHVACIDRWLGSHSTCPLCRHRIDPADVAVSNRSSDANGLHLSLEREENLPNRKINDQDQELLHKHKHRVRVSGAVFKGRWSDLNSSDLVLLGSEMISSERFRNGTDSIGKITEEMGRKRALERRANEITVPSPSRLDWSFSREALLSQGDHKCMSDITGVTRFSDGSEDDDEVRRIWLPIARKTVRWFAGEERGRSELERTSTAQEAAFVSEV